MALPLMALGIFFCQIKTPSPDTLARVLAPNSPTALPSRSVIKALGMESPPLLMRTAAGHCGVPFARLNRIIIPLLGLELLKPDTNWPSGRAWFDMGASDIKAA